jgi:REP element-mobilizing transposase RayT
MARPLRIEFPGAVYHVTARGNALKSIFLDDQDRLSFLEVLEQVVSRFHLVLHAYCLMGNHYHLLLETPQANLSKALRQLNGVYTQAFNRRHGRLGHVLRGRFKAILIDRDAYLLGLCRYVVLNPVRAKITRKPDTYRWSSYRASAGLSAAPVYLSTDWLLAQFGKQRATCEKRYQSFVAEGIGQESPWNQVRAQVLLGAESFVKRLQPGLWDKRGLKNIPRRLATRPTLSKLFNSATLADKGRRNEVIQHAHLEHGYSLSQIGDAVGLHYSSISRIVNRDNGQNKI